MIDYWRDRRAGGLTPARADIDPAGFVHLVPRVFIAARDFADVRFRLAGEAMIELFGREAAPESALALWRSEHRGRVAALLVASLIAGEPIVLEARGDSSEGASLALEMLFAPLIGPRGVADRFLGLCQPLSGVAYGPLSPLVLVAVNGRPAERAHLRLAAVGGRRIA